MAAVRRSAVVVAGEAGLLEVGPEAQLVLKLGRIAPVQERLEEDRRLGIRPSVLVAEAEVLRVPARFTRDRLADVRVDLRQRMVARNPAERVRQGRIDAGVVQRMPGLV